MSESTRKKVLQMLEGLCPDIALDHSYKIFHTEGIRYINLVRTQHYTAKIYILESYSLNDQGYLVNPHNHSYDFTTNVLVGKVTNVLFRIEPYSLGDWHLCEYKTPLNGGKGSRKKTKCTVHEMSREEFCRNQSYDMNHKDLHTLIPSIGWSETILFLEQFQDVNKTTHFLSKEPDSDECVYERYTKSEMIQEITHLRKELK